MPTPLFVLIKPFRPYNPVGESLFKCLLQRHNDWSGKSESATFSIDYIDFGVIHTHFQYRSSSNLRLLCESR